MPKHAYAKTQPKYKVMEATMSVARKQGGTDLYNTNKPKLGPEPPRYSGHESAKDPGGPPAAAGPKSYGKKGYM